MIARTTSLAGAMLAASLVLTPHPSAAEGTPSCDGSAPGVELKVLPEHSSVGTTGVMCNYKMESTDGQHNTSGMAITIEYGCPAQMQEAFKSKTGERRSETGDVIRYDRSKEIFRGEVSRSGNSLLMREDREGEGYAGSFSVQEKMFILVDSQTIATIVVLTAVKPPPPPPPAPPSDGGDSAAPAAESAPAPKPDPDILIFSADQAAGLAQSIAGAHGGLKANLKCDAAPPKTEEEEKPPAMALKVKLGLTTASGRREIPFGESVSFPVTVSATVKDKDEAVAKKHFAPLEVALHRDDTLLEKKMTDSEGSVTFTYTPPEDTPDNECKAYRFKAVAAREGIGSAEDGLEAEIQRGECEHVVVRVSRDGVDLPTDDPPIVFTPAKDGQVRFQVEAELDHKRVVKQFRFHIGGPLASSASIEQAQPTETPGEYEVRDVETARVVLVVSALSEDDVARATGGILLEVRASPD